MTKTVSNRLLVALLPLGVLSIACSGRLDVGDSAPPAGSSPREVCAAHSDETKQVVQEVDRTILNFTSDAEYTYYLSEPTTPHSAASSTPFDDSPATVLKRVSRTGGTPSELARSFSTLQTRSTLMEQEVGIAVTGDWVYWTATRDDNTGNALFRVNRSGGDKQRVTDDSDSPAGYLVADAARTIYFTNRGQGRARLVGIGPDGTRRVIVGEGDDDIASFALDDKEVFWTELPRLGAMGLESKGLVQATLLDGTKTRTLYGPVPNDDLRVRDVSETDVYLTGVQGGLILGALRLPKAGGEPASFMSDKSSTDRLILAGADVVWTTATEVRRLKEGATQSETLAYDTSGVSQLRASDCDIFWSDRLNGSLKGSAIYRRSR